MNKILFTGAESSGKTTMACWTTRQYNGILVPEYARYYLLDRTEYNKDDVVHIGHAQMSLEADLFKVAVDYLVADTSLLVIDIWLRDKFNSNISEIGFNLAHLRSFTHIFLCKPDFPWKYDMLRENPDDQMRLHDIYREALHQLDLPFVTLEGSLEKRKEQILQYLK